MVYIAVFTPLFKVDLRNIPIMPKIHTGPVLFSFLSTTRVLNVGSFLLIVLKLYSYKDGDVGNLRKFEYFYDYFKHSRNA